MLVGYANAGKPSENLKDWIGHPHKRLGVRLVRSCGLAARWDRHISVPKTPRTHGAKPDQACSFSCFHFIGVLHQQL